jgi:hypothetical protein
LVHTPDRSSNKYWVGRVLAKLEENRFFCQQEKCLFEKDEVEFLGMTLRAGEVKVSSSKVEAIKRELPPMMKKGVHRFLGLTNYHRQFIKGYSHLARPLHDLMKDVPFQWTEDCQHAFEGLKDALTTSSVLALPGDSGKFRLEMDTSDIATGAVLSQQQADGTYWPLGYSSKSYNNAEKNYTTYDKEMLAIMWGLDKWRNLLIEASEPFEICTNHQNLTYFKDPQKLTGWQVNWTTKLQDFNYVIWHVSGESNARADALSCLDRVEKPEVKKGVLLPERLFTRFLSGSKDLDQEEEPVSGRDGEAMKKLEEILPCHIKESKGPSSCYCREGRSGKAFTRTLEDTFRDA